MGARRRERVRASGVRRGPLRRVAKKKKEEEEEQLMEEDASWHCITMRGMECAHPATARARARVRTIGSQASATPRAPPSSLKIALRP